MRTLLVFAIIGLWTMDAAAQVVDVATEAELRGAILVVQSGGVINFQADITLTADLPAIQQDLIIDGHDHVLSGGGTFRGLFVYSGTVTIRNLTIQEAFARGGDGGNGDDSVVGAGGGGGAGLGGALFVGAGANVTIDRVRLLTNESRGGDGGHVANIFGTGSGGGGGLGGHGSPLGGGGGGIGVGADGGVADLVPSPGAIGIVTGAAGGGKGDDDFDPGAPGGANGGGGGGGQSSGGGGIAGGDGTDLQAGAGGFGGGGGGALDGSGGAGGFGGGGGGTAWSGGGAGSAGSGGFGGGGGGGRLTWIASGGGGFGGGAGGPGATSTAAGVGGGGAGMGGAIFVMQGGSLTVTGTLAINGNTVAPGAASGAAQGGRAFGSGLFLHGDGHLVFEPAAGELQVIDNEIADVTGSGGTAAPDVGSWTLLKRGTGTLHLAGTNSFTGGVIVYEGALRLSPGPSPIGSGRLTLHGGVVRPGGSADFTNPITLGALGAGGGVFDLTDINWPVASVIMGQGGLTVVGGRILALTASNHYTGGTIVRDNSTVLITSELNLGAVTGPLTLNGGTLWTQGSIGSSRPITIGELGGTFTTDSFSVILDGPFDGAGALIKRGASTLSLYGISTRTGSLHVAEGRLRIGQETLLWPTAPVAVDAAGVLEILGVRPTIGSLSGLGTVALAGAATLAIGGDGTSTMFAGAIGGTGGITKIGAGTLTLSGISPFTGTTTIEGGVLNVTGSLASSAFVMTAGTLTGTGTIGAVTMSGGTFMVTVNGSTGVGAEHDQLVVTGGVTLQGATLQVVVNVTPALDTPLVILDNDDADPIAGTFAGLPEGAILTIGDTRFRISYIGGSGNDVVLLRARPEVEPLTWTLAEGATGVFFDFDLLLANPRNEPVPVTIEFLSESGATITETRTLPATSRTTIRVDEIPGLEAAAVSTLVTSTTGVPIVVERTMRWDASGYGAHTEKATAGAAATWYFAEGSQGFFSTYFLLVNPHDTANAAHVTYLRQGEPALVRDYPLGPHARVTIDAGTDTELIDRAFGARIVFDQPATAERAMYFGRDPLFSGGHESAGATAPSTHWFLAEGATGSYFTTYVLLANPNDTEAVATLTYLPASGIPVIKTHSIPPNQRVTINIAMEDASLASAAVATRVSSTLPLVVERAQYWPNPNWHEAHNSVGVTGTSTKWGLAEGRVGGANGYQTYILLANSETQAADVTLTFLRADGTTLVKTVTVPPTSRFNVGVTGPGSDVPELADESFGTLIESTQPVVVERSMYANANGVIWAAGTNATATRLP